MNSLWNTNMKTLIQAVVVATLFAASAAQAQQAVQWRVEDGGNGHWYADDNRPLADSFAARQSRYEAIGGHLATVTSAAEHNFIVSVAFPSGFLLPSDNWPALGAHKPAFSSSWDWVTGEPFAYSPFSPDPPQFEMEQYLMMWGTGTTPLPWWTGNGNQTLQRSIVEWDADCNNDGIVDYGQCRDGSLPDYNGNNIPDCCESGTPCVVGNYPVQWRVEDGGNGRWYQVMTYAFSPSWESARGDARSMGGDLTSFQSLAEMDFCLRLAEQRPMAWRRLPATGAWWGPWVGAFQEPGAAEPSGGWEWLDSPGLAFVSENRMTFNNQASCCGGNENRLFMYTNGPAVRFEFLELNDIPETGSCQGDCSHGPMVFSSVIEWSADCNNDGIVDKGQILLGQLADTNQDGIPDVCQIPTCHDADLYTNGVINGADLAALLSEWGPVTPATRADIDQDGKVDGADLAFLLSFWGLCST